MSTVLRGKLADQLQLKKARSTESVALRTPMSRSHQAVHIHTPRWFLTNPKTHVTVAEGQIRGKTEQQEGATRAKRVQQRALSWQDVRKQSPLRIREICQRL